MRGGPGADTLVITSPFEGTSIYVHVIGWQPGIDKIGGKIDGMDTRAYLLKHFDRNKDKHITLADGPFVKSGYRTLEFVYDEQTGHRSIECSFAGYGLYFYDVTTLF